MLDLAKHIVSQKTSTFEPEKFEDHYEEALTELINAKRNGKPRLLLAPTEILRHGTLITTYCFHMRAAKRRSSRPMTSP
jgi:non-homologous end joining protein Ku